MDIQHGEIFDFILKAGAGLATGLTAAFGFFVQQLNKKDKIIAEKDEYIKELVEGNKELMEKYYGITKDKLKDLIRDTYRQDED